MNTATTCIEIFPLSQATSMCNEGFSLDFNHSAHDSSDLLSVHCKAASATTTTAKKSYLIIGWRWTIRAKSEKLIYIAAWRVWVRIAQASKIVVARPSASVSETSTCKTHFAFLMIKDSFSRISYAHRMTNVLQNTQARDEASPRIVRESASNHFAVCAINFSRHKQQFVRKKRKHSEMNFFPQALPSCLMVRLLQAFMSNRFRGVMAF